MDVTLTEQIKLTFPSDGQRKHDKRTNDHLASILLSVIF